MIGLVRGVLIDRLPSGELLVDVQGVGYRVSVPVGALASVGDLGDEVVLHTHLHVREDAMVLYGFASREERVCFEALLGAHGVGPALALAILSVHRPAALRQILLGDDVDALTHVPGVGKKTAARLLLELKSRLDVPDLDLDAGDSSPSTASSARRDVRDALAGLGYGPDEVREVLADLPPDGEPEALLKEALRRLAISR